LVSIWPLSLVCRICKFYLYPSILFVVSMVWVRMRNGSLLYIWGDCFQVYGTRIPFCCTKFCFAMVRVYKMHWYYLPMNVCNIRTTIQTLSARSRIVEEYHLALLKVAMWSSSADKNEKFKDPMADCGCMRPSFRSGKEVS
jgi:hypothetical protein